MFAGLASRVNEDSPVVVVVVLEDVGLLEGGQAGALEGRSGATVDVAERRRRLR